MKSIQIIRTPLYPENTDILYEHLQNDDDEDNAIVAEIIKKSIKWKGGPEMFDEIMVEG